MDELRGCARRAPIARYERAFDAPVHATSSLLVSAFVVVLAAIASVLSGLPLLAVLAVTLVVALASAVIARRTFASIFAGLILLLVRPYAAGELLRFYSTAQARYVDGEIVRVGLANTTIATAVELIVVPNSQLLRVAPEPIEPGPAAEKSMQA